MVASVVAIAGVPIAPNGSASATTARAVVPVRDQTIAGRLLIAHGDNFATGSMMMQAGLRTSSGYVRLTLPASQHGEALTLAGSQVRVQGSRRAGSFAAASVAPVTGAPIAVSRAVPAARAPKVMRIAVVLTRFAGSTAVPATKAAVKASTFGAKKSVASWFSQTSGHQVVVTGTVYGYYTGVRTCDLGTQLSAGAAAAAKDGYVASKFDHLVVVAPTQVCGFTGIGWVGQNGAFLNGDTSPGVMEHELGHNLGLWHAGAYACGAGAMAKSCLTEYGDPSDVMGSPYLNHGYNAEHKYQVGWIPPAEVRTVTTGAHTIVLTASEDPVVAGATELIHLRVADGTVYSIDKRASIGYDAGLSGVWIRRLSPTPTVDTALVRGSAYGPGTTFTGGLHHVTVKILKDNAARATVRVCIGACT